MNKRTLLLAAGAVVLVIAGAASGAVLGPKLFPQKPHPAKVVEEEDDEEDETPTHTSSFEPMVVDVRDHEGELHHLRLGIAVTTKKPIPEEELKTLTPQVRDAAIGYLRSLTMEDVTDAAKYESLRTELISRIRKSAGKLKTKKVLFTDFVVQ